MNLRRALLGGIVALGCSFSVNAMELLMFEEHGCPWCARWNADVGGVYAESEEGLRAPLRRLDIRDQPVPGVEMARRAHYTPTFILVADGREIGRIEGYPGADFFWGLLGRMLREADEAAAR
ncbi:MAG: hypothetical protein ACFCUS_11385 [Rubrimonas sp.]|uniref:hypothetical protein n=1 Tax=Rubrimonas sp. TaxID=2036015 RepID=UPI002FDE6CB2